MSKVASFNLMQIAERFSTEEAARKYLEARLWPEGPVCPHCGGCEAYVLTPKPTSTKPGRKGLYKCKYCRKQFTVTVGTIFEDSHIPLNKWLIAIYLMCSSKKGISAHQLHRMLNLSYKAAWFMCHRVRYAMKQGPVLEKMGGIVEADETYVGGKRRQGSWKKSGFAGGPAAHMAPVVALVERGGRVRSFHMKRVTSENLLEVLTDNIEASARLMTDEYSGYRSMHKTFASHETVNHKEKEYARGDVTTNTVEGFFGLLKRGVNGVYHHLGPHHLHRYLAEFDFRYNARKVSDGDRTDFAISGVVGKRLKYRD
jgi:transposase-like protein